MKIKDYFELIQKEVEKCYAVAREAKSKGVDPVSDIEVPVAMSLADKAIGLISSIYPQLQDERVVRRIFELEKQYGQLDIAVAFVIAEEIAKEKFCKFGSLLQAMEAGIRVGFAYVTLGVVSSPIEGFTELKIKKTRQGAEYLCAYFSGPIRSAGTTASCVVLMLIDYLRECFGFSKYDPDENEVKRYVIENYDYHERVTNLQYLPTEEEIVFLAKNLPIEISGDPSEEREVSNYKDLARIETNRIRGGMCLIFSEGLAQKAQKGLRLLRGFQAKGFRAIGWDFLEKYIELFKKKSKASDDKSPVYIKDLVAGRPVLCHPSKPGGFRMRYGRGRVGGFSATAIHPATMAITDSFLSFGTQLKIEKPTKGCAIAVCDEIEGPIVKLINGSVRKIKNFDEAKKIYDKVEEIVYLGDILVSLGDFINRNCELLKAGYCEEWWELELRKAGFSGDIDKFKINFNETARFSKEYRIPLHPKYIFNWRAIELEIFRELLEWIRRGRIVEEKLILSYTSLEKEKFAKGKRALELIGCELEVSLEHVIVGGDEMRALFANLGILGGELNKEIMIEKYCNNEDVLENINELSEFRIKDKLGSFIGARMGRPEKAKLRKLTGSPHVLFPVGDAGGRFRSFQAALEVGDVYAEFPIYWCKGCNKETVYPRCEICHEQCMKLRYSPVKDKIFFENEVGGEKLLEFRGRRIDVRHYFEIARRKLGLTNDEIRMIPVIKGVRGTSSKDHSCEELAKGILRAKYGLNVNKDGTIRYDMTEMAVTHFKPKEIGTSIVKLREMGYEEDIYGKGLEDEEQILELFPHDVILPACPVSDDERADDVILRICNFVDDELEKIYNLGRFFNVRKREDLIGILVACIAPHICTATVGRIIGFSKTQTFLASPYMHAAMRRDADGDESAFILLMDMLINFSRKFLPAHRGGTQDAPLVLNVMIKAGDVDDQILDFELGKYPLELYELAEQGKHSSEVKVDNVKSRLKLGEDPFRGVLFTHDCYDFNNSVLNSSYKILPTMDEKVDRMMGLCSKIRAVDVKDVARLVIERHFVRDTRGNLRKFSMQVFRCVNCNSKYRRPPLGGQCTKCGGRLIFTISEGSILKYMQKALELARNYHVSPYLLESLELTEMYIQSIFGKEKEKQEALGKWV